MWIYLAPNRGNRELENYPHTLTDTEYRMQKGGGGRTSVIALLAHVHKHRQVETVHPLYYCPVYSIHPGHIVNEIITRGLIRKLKHGLQAYIYIYIRLFFFLH